MVKEPTNPIVDALDLLPDSAWGRIFSVSRQSIAQWRKYSSIPRAYMRSFAELTGVSVNAQLESAELSKGILFDAFLRTTQERFVAERARKRN